METGLVMISPNGRADKSNALIFQWDKKPAVLRLRDQLQQQSIRSQQIWIGEGGCGGVWGGGVGGGGGGTDSA